MYPMQGPIFAPDHNDSDAGDGLLTTITFHCYDSFPGISRFDI